MNEQAFEAMDAVKAEVDHTAQVIENLKLYAPVETNDYDFPVTEIPLVADSQFGTFNDERIGGLLDTDMKAILRTDTNKVISCVSNKYTTVPHNKIVDIMENNLRKDYDFEKKVFTTHDGARMYAEYKIQGLDKSIGEDDKVGMNLIAKNSYDASTSMSMILQGLRLICLNGMMGMGDLFYFGKRHVGNIQINDDIGREIERAIKVYNDSLIPFWQKLNEKELSKGFGIDIIKDVSEKNVVPIKYKEEITRKWEYEAAQENAWFLYNCYTAVLTHTIKKKSYENYINLSKRVGAYFKTRFAESI